MKLACLLAIGVGFITLILAISGKIANVQYEAAVGVFIMMIGFNGLASIRIAKLEKALKNMRKEQHEDKSFGG